MSRPFEDELAEYASERDAAEAPPPIAEQRPALPDGFEASADPRYAYSKDSGHWLDTHTGVVSYYDEDAQVYVPLRRTTCNAPHEPCFAGVARLVVAESTCLAAGHVVDIGADEGLTIGRDRLEGGGARHLRVPEMEVSRHHLRIYFGGGGDETLDCDPRAAIDNAGSENGEIGGDDEPGVHVGSTGPGELSEGECEEDDGPVHAAATTHTPGFYAVDQGSMHGTFVNQQRLSGPKAASKPVRLRHLDRVVVGSTALDVHIHEQWACAACQNTGDNEISTVQTTASRPGPRTAVLAVPRTSLLQERIDGLRAMQRRYTSPRPRGVHKTGAYTDRARLRRSMQGSAVATGVREVIREDPEQPSTRPVAGHAPAIGQDNRGFGMLQRMGWSPGSGLGADRGGIVDPVDVAGNDDRSGLGAARPPADESAQSRVSRITRQRFHER
ncbi:hypothetical protein H4R19_002778 [Coemansia spiralis]|nr:hypothetical protein H4R19_002778 [Coemansia spiralis]